METTVTMSLERYKQLESFEKAIKVLQTGDDVHIVKDRFSQYPELIFSSKENFNILMVEQRNEAIKQRDETIAKVRAFEEKTKQKVF